MKEIVSQVDKVIVDGKVLLSKPTLKGEDLNLFKKNSFKVFKLIIEKNINETLSELAARGFETNIKRFKNIIYQRIYNFFTESRDDITYDAPYLKKRTESDYNKAEIFWTIEKLKGIKHNLELLMNKK